MAPSTLSRGKDSAPKQNDVGSAAPEPQNSVSVIKAKKLPPDEPQGKLFTRRLIILSFWVAAVLIGVPIWWQTTTVYRANLPLQSMFDWGEGKTCSPLFPLNIVLDTPELRPDEAHHLLHITQHALDDLNEFPVHHLRLSKRLKKEPSNAREGPKDALEESDKSADLVVQLLPSQEVPGPVASLRPHSRVVDVTYSPNMIPQSTSTSSMLATYIANQLEGLFAEEKAILANLLSKSNSVHSSQPRYPQLPAATVEDLSRRDTRSVKYAPTYHLTFSLFTPSALPSAWDIEEALARTFSPLLEAFSTISRFTIDTQVQPYASFSPSIQPVFDEAQKAWVLNRDDLGGFINAAEWPLSPSIGTGPTINFLLYVPDPSQTPLTIHNASSGTNSWLVPQWGGVSILNPSMPPTSGFISSKQQRQQRLTVDDLHPHLLTFTSHLISLLNVPNTPASSFPLRLSSLERQHAASLILRASNTLASLAHLVVHLPSISIPDQAATSVEDSLRHLEDACTALRAGRFHQALENARDAEQEAEKAFFERSMVGQVYFPDEHKVAVYLPLLGPMAVPLVLGALQEFKNYLWLRRKKR